MNYILIETDLTGYPDTRLLFPQLQPRNEFHQRVNWHLMDELVKLETKLLLNYAIGSNRER